MMKKKTEKRKGNVGGGGVIHTAPLLESLLTKSVGGKSEEDE